MDEFLEMSFESFPGIRFAVHGGKIRLGRGDLVAHVILFVGVVDCRDGGVVVSVGVDDSEAAAVGFDDHDCLVYDVLCCFLVII